MSEPPNQRAAFSARNFVHYYWYTALKLFYISSPSSLVLYSYVIRSLDRQKFILESRVISWRKRNPLTTSPAHPLLHPSYTTHPLRVKSGWKGLLKVSESFFKSLACLYPIWWEVFKLLRETANLCNFFLYVGFGYNVKIITNWIYAQPVYYFISLFTELREFQWRPVWRSYIKSNHGFKNRSKTSEQRLWLKYHVKKKNYIIELHYRSLIKTTKSKTI